MTTQFEATALRAAAIVERLAAVDTAVCLHASCAQGIGAKDGATEDCEFGGVASCAQWDMSMAGMASAVEVFCAIMVDWMAQLALRLLIAQERSQADDQDDIIARTVTSSTAIGPLRIIREDSSPSTVLRTTLFRSLRG